MNLKLSENFLDETETNMESEEECLGEVLQNWLLYHNPILETLNLLDARKLSAVYFVLYRTHGVLRRRGAVVEL